MSFSLRQNARTPKPLSRCRASAARQNASRFASRLHLAIACLHVPRDSHILTTYGWGMKMRLAERTLLLSVAASAHRTGQTIGWAHAA